MKSSVHRLAPVLVATLTYSSEAFSFHATPRSTKLFSDASLSTTRLGKRIGVPATHLFSSMATTLPEGLSKSVSKEGSGPPLNIGDVVTVRYSCYTPEKAATPFAKSDGQRMIVGDGMMIDGWEMALQSMRGGERSVIKINDPKYGYGSAGVPPFVPANSKIEMDMEVLTVEEGVDLGTIASADPLKPRTPASIAAAYATRRELAALEEADKKEGLDGLIAKFKTFYFFGFFEGETGQQAPWYLRPSITFPLAFASVGATFFVMFSFGGIKERGAQVTDDLDELLVSFAGTPLQQAVVVLCLLGSAFVDFGL